MDLKYVFVSEFMQILIGIRQDAAENEAIEIVFFQWEHVAVDQQKKLFLVGMNVDNALYNHRPLPRWPLRSRSQGIYFSIEWLSAFAD